MEAEPECDVDPAGHVALRSAACDLRSAAHSVYNPPLQGSSFSRVMAHCMWPMKVAVAAWALPETMAAWMRS